MIENTIISAIKEVGFPIVAFLLMWYTANTSIKKLTEMVKELKTEIRLLRKNNYKPS